MYRCRECGAILEEDELKVELYDPAQGMFDNPMYERWLICPYCGSDDYEDYEEEEEGMDELKEEIADLKAENQALKRVLEDARVMKAYYQGKYEGFKEGLEKKSTPEGALISAHDEYNTSGTKCEGGK